jgi:peptide/nickel transport system substrate-binding protein
MTAGIQVDDAARRVTFQLSKPDPGFLDKLALVLAVATPPEAPSVESAKPLPSTGPYQITFIKGQSIVLRRNPHFRRWSYTAQPDGYPDVIRYVKGGSSQASHRADIIAGRADVIRESADEATNKQLHARYPSQLHEQVRFDTSCRPAFRATSPTARTPPEPDWSRTSRKHGRSLPHQARPA